MRRRFCLFAAALAVVVVGLPASRDVRTVQAATSTEIIGRSSESVATGLSARWNRADEQRDEVAAAGESVLMATETVTFAPNGGSGAMADQLSSLPASLSANTFSRAGYSFDGWNTAANGSGTAYADEASYPFASSTTLYAQWRKDVSGPTDAVDAGLVEFARFEGRYSFSADGMADASGSGSLQIEYPAGATLSAAFLTMPSRRVRVGDFPFPNTAVLAGTSVEFTHRARQSTATREFDNRFADVTDIVRGVLNAATPGTVTVAATYSRTGPDSSDDPEIPSEQGLALTVFFEDPAQPVGVSMFQFGHARTTGETITLTFPPLSGSPVAMPLSLGIGWGFQALPYGTGTGQGLDGYNFVDIKTSSDPQGAALSNYSGGCDDSTVCTAIESHSSWDLITVGGVGDSLANPSGAWVDFRSDDELYDLSAFLGAGDTSLTLETANPSGDDTIFQLAASFPGIAGLSITTDPTVSFVANGGTGSMMVQSSSVSATLNPNTFSRAGYNFTGWNTTVTGSGVAYADGATYPFIESTTLYAQWELSASDNAVGQGLIEIARFEGRYSFSADGMADASGSGSLQIDYPAGATLSAAYLTMPSKQLGGAAFPFPPTATATLNGTSVTFTHRARDNDLSTVFDNRLADVTDIVRGVLNATTSGTTVTVSATYTQTGDPALRPNEQGLALTVFFEDPSQPVGVSMFQFGHARTTGETITLTFPPLSGTPVAMPLSLGIGWGFQALEYGTGTGQSREGYNFVDIKTSSDPQGSALSSYAGGCDDSTVCIRSSALSWDLITVGGVGDSLANPSGAWVDYRSDDELYDLSAFLGAGDTSLTLETVNPSGDDTIFQLVASFPGIDGLSIATDPTVSFVANGGTGSMAVQSSSVSATLSPNAFSRAGYDFVGWNTAADGRGISYADEASYPFTSSTALFAQWVAASPPPPPPTTTTTVPTSSAVPTTTVPPSTAPVTQPPNVAIPPPPPVTGLDGELPEVEPGEAEVIEGGAEVAVDVSVEEDSATLVRSENFELRLAGDCTSGCTVVNDANGRETIYLDSFGRAKVSGAGFKPGTPVHVWVFSEPRYLGALTVEADGTFAGSFPLEDLEAGHHTLQVSGISADDEVRSANLGIVVRNTVDPSPGAVSLPRTGRSSNPAVVLAIAMLALGVLVTSRRRVRID